MKKLCTTAAVLAALLFPVVVTAQDNDTAAEGDTKVTLRVGDPAPPLTPGKWIKGEPVKAFAPGTVYVVEFWATWCPPCRTSIPHLTELQAKFKDKNVIIIGQNVSDNPEKVPAFVEKQGDKMNYRVAVDDLTDKKRGQMNLAWMEAAGAAGIPTAFIVDKAGKIAWIGHPMQLDGVLARVVAGTYDPLKEAAAEAKQRKLEQEIAQAMTAGEVDKALKLADDMVAQNPAKADQILGLKFQLLLQKKDYAAAYALGAQLFEAFKNEPEALNALAWMIADEEGLEKRDLALAEKMAVRANELTKGEVSAVLDTVARVYAAQGQLDKAIAWEIKAVAKASADDKEQFQQTLEAYKAQPQSK